MQWTELPIPLLKNINVQYLWNHVESIIIIPNSSRFHCPRCVISRIPHFFLPVFPVFPVSMASSYGLLDPSPHRSSAKVETYFKSLRRRPSSPSGGLEEGPSWLAHWKTTHLEGNKSNKSYGLMERILSEADPKLVRWHYPKGFESMYPLTLDLKMGTGLLTFCHFLWRRCGVPKTELPGFFDPVIACSLA